MQQIKCDKCSKTWYINDKDLLNIVACTFCTEKIRKKIKIIGPDTLGKLIYQVISCNGLEILASAEKTASFLFDITQGEALKREVKIFSKTFSDEYLKIYQKAFNEELTEAENVIRRLKYIFTSEEGLAEEWAELLFENCFRAVKYYKGVNEGCIVSIGTKEIYMGGKEEEQSLSLDKRKNGISKEYSNYAGKNKRKIDDKEDEPDNEKALERWVKFRQQGALDAKFKTNDCHYNGLISCLVSSLTNQQQFKAGECYYNGIGVAENKEEAFKWYHKAAEQGHKEAQYMVGECYYFGKGVVKNQKEAYNWYIEAAEKGHAEAQYKVGNCYYYGQGVEQNRRLAFFWYLKAADQNFKDAQYLLGVYDSKYITADEEKIVSKWSIEGAEKGDLTAQYRAGQYYDYEVKNKEKAFYWYMEAAKQGHVGAQYRVAVCYHYGNGIGIDKLEAYKWYKNAAKKGHKEAKEQKEYLKREGVRKEKGRLSVWGNYIDGKDAETKF